MTLDEMITDGFWCNECRGYGDDYYFDEDGELVSACKTCPIWLKDGEEDLMEEDEDESNRTS